MRNVQRFRRVRYKGRHSAKSGVVSGILAAVPGRFGVGTFGPALDRKGNSVVGFRMLCDLSRRLALSIS